MFSSLRVTPVPACGQSATAWRATLHLLPQLCAVGCVICLCLVPVWLSWRGFIPMLGGAEAALAGRAVGNCLCTLDMLAGRGLGQGQGQGVGLGLEQGLGLGLEQGLGLGLGLGQGLG